MARVLFGFPSSLPDRTGVICPVWIIGVADSAGIFGTWRAHPRRMVRHTASYAR
ncbi:hypothetical protein T261_6113 [Streptomyces lydicus]|nr:hypothetical protein T261_6113 [Streptomyces lydicus]